MMKPITVITGSRSGLGFALSNALRVSGHIVYGYDMHDDLMNDVVRPNMEFLGGLERVDVLINCAGINRIDWLEKFSEADWDEIMDTNAKGIFMMTKALLPQLIQSKGTVVNIVSNASHKPMTCSAAYNASKGAAHILTQQLARELTKRHGITVFGVAPNKLCGTEMSSQIDEAVIRTRGWTRGQAEEYQLASLLTGEETPPENVAEFIAWLLSHKDRHRFLTGCVLPYGV